MTHEITALWNHTWSFYNCLFICYYRTSTATRIRYTPTILFLRDKEIIDRIDGAEPKDLDPRIRKWVGSVVTTADSRIPSMARSTEEVKSITPSETSPERRPIKPRKPRVSTSVNGLSSEPSTARSRSPPCHKMTSNKCARPRNKSKSPKVKRK